MMTVGDVLAFKLRRGGKMPRTIKWIGGKQCDLCREGVKLQGPEFYDAQVKVPAPPNRAQYPGQMMVTWALVCYKCKDVICGIGQVYDCETGAKICNVQDRR